MQISRLTRALLIFAVALLALDQVLSPSIFTENSGEDWAGWYAGELVHNEQNEIIGSMDPVTRKVTKPVITPIVVDDKEIYITRACTSGSITHCDGFVKININSNTAFYHEFDGLQDDIGPPSLIAFALVDIDFDKTKELLIVNQYVITDDDCNDYTELTTEASPLRIYKLTNNKYHEISSKFPLFSTIVIEYVHEKLAKSVETANYIILLLMVMISPLFALVIAIKAVFRFYKGQNVNSLVGITLLFASIISFSFGLSYLPLASWLILFAIGTFLSGHSAHNQAHPAK